MGLFDFFNPSRESDTNSPFLPAPPFNFDDLGGMVGGLFGAAGQGVQQAEQGFAGAYDTFQQDFDNLRQNANFGDFFRQAQQNAGQFYQQQVEPLAEQIPHYTAMGLMSPGLGGRFAAPVEQGLGEAEDYLAQQAREKPWMPGLAPARDIVSLAKGPAHLMSEGPAIEDKFKDAFHKGIQSISYDQNGIHWSHEDTQEALKDLLTISEEYQTNILGPEQFHEIIKNHLLDTGNSEKESDEWATALAPLTSFIAQIGATAPISVPVVGTAMGVQLALQLAADPAGFIRNLKEQAVGPDENEDPNKPDYSAWNLIKKSYAASTGSGPGPTKEEVSNGLLSMANLAGIGLAAHGTLRVGIGGVERVRGTTHDIKTGGEIGGIQEPVPGQEVGGIPGEVSPAGGIGPAIEGRDEAAIQAAQEVGPLATPARPGEIPEAEGIPEARPEPVPAVIRTGESVNNYQIDYTEPELPPAMSDAVHRTTEFLNNSGATSVKGIKFYRDAEGENFGYFDIDHPQEIMLNHGTLEGPARQWEREDLERDAQHYLNTLEKYPVEDQEVIRTAIGQVRSYGEVVLNSSVADNLKDVASHESIHADMWNATQHALTADLAKKVEQLPVEIQKQAKLGLALYQQAVSTPEGRAWLDHPSTARAVGEDITAIRDFLEEGKLPSIAVDENPFIHLAEFHTYQTNWRLGGSRHPYALQSGEKAYSETLFQREAAEENAALAENFYRAVTGNYTPVQPRSFDAAPAVPADIAPTAARRAVNDPRNQASLAKEQSDTDVLPPEQAVRKISAGIQRLTSDLERKLAQIEADPKALNLKPEVAAASLKSQRESLQAIQSTLDSHVQNIKNLEKIAGQATTQKLIDNLGKLGVATESYRGKIYNAEMDRIADSGWREPLYNLRDVAIEARSARDAFDEARRSGVVGRPLTMLENRAAKAVAQFSRAYDLHTSEDYRAASTYKPARGINNLTQRVYKVLTSKTVTEVNPSEFAAKSVGLTTSEAMNNVRNARLGIFPDNPLHDPRNWDDQFVDLFTDKASREVAAAKDDTPVALGYQNIPLEKMLEGHFTLNDLVEAEKLGHDIFSKNSADLANELARARLGRRAKVPGAEQEVKLLQRQINVERANWANYQRKLARIRMNHPQLRRITQNIAEEATPEEGRELLANNRDEIIRDVNHSISDVPVGAGLVEEARQINSVLTTPSHNPIDLVNPEGEVPSDITYLSERYAPAHQAMTALGGDHAEFANIAHDFLKSVADHIEPGKNTFSLEKWLTAFKNNNVGIDYRVHQLSLAARRLIPDIETSKRILRPIQVLTKNPAKAEQLLHELSPQEATLARFMHELWDSTGTIAADPKLGMLDNKIDDFVPHIVTKLPDGTVIDTRTGKEKYEFASPRKLRNISKFSEHQLNRVRDSVTNETIFDTLTDLENAGYGVEWDAATLLNAHLRSTFRAVNNREMLNYFMSSANFNDGKILGPPVIPAERFREFETNANFKGIDMNNYTTVRLGPYSGTMGRYLVYKPLAKEMEKYASASERPAANIIKFLETLNGFYKLKTFALNPYHAFNVYTNVVSVVHGPKGLLGLADPRLIYKIWGRPNRAMMDEQQSWTYGKIQATKGLVPGLKGFDKQRVATTAELTKLERDHSEAVRQLNETLERQSDFLSRSVDPRTRRVDLNKAQTYISKVQQEALSFNKSVETLEKRIEETRKSLEKGREVFDSFEWVRDKEELPIAMSKGLVPDSDIASAADIGRLSVLNKIPFLGRSFHAWERWMWHDMVWKAQLGTYLELKDQFVKRLASNQYGYKGKSVREAENLLTPLEIDKIREEAVYYAKSATGLWNQQDHSQWVNFYGRSAMFSQSWTMGQMRNLVNALGTPISRTLKFREDTRPFSQTMKEAGWTPETQGFLDSLHTDMARRMVIGAAMKWMVTSAIIASFGSLWATGKMSTPVDNFTKDPVHTFDVYTGDDPATKKATWRTFPYYRAIGETAQYILAGVKKAQQGGAPGDIAGTVSARMLGKVNPAGVATLEAITGIELGKLWNGIPGSNIDEDNDLANLHRALNALGVPDFPLENRVLFALRAVGSLPPPFGGMGFAPPMAIKRDENGKPIYDAYGNEIPLDDPRSLLTSVVGSGIVTGIGWDLASYVGTGAWPERSPLGDINTDVGEDAKTLAMYGLGSTKTASRTVQQDIDRQAKEKQYQEMGDLKVQLVQAATKGDFDTVAKIQQDLGLTSQQTTELILRGASRNSGRSGGSDYVKGIISTPGEPGVRAAKEIDGHILTPQESTKYDELLTARNLYVISEVQKMPEFQGGNTTEKVTMLDNYMKLADKVSKAQMSQELGLTGGETITDEQVKTLMQTYTNSRPAVMAALSSSDMYKNASPAAQQRMIDSYMNTAASFAYDKTLGDYKNMSDKMYYSLIYNALDADVQTKNYLQNTPFYQNQPELQNKMETEYSNLTRKMVENVYSGKVTNIYPEEIPIYMKATINTEETSKYLLHQTQFYQAASLPEQEKLDNKYQRLSRALATRDWNQGIPMLNLDNVLEEYTAGPDKIMLGHMVADQAFRDLQENYGGTEMLAAQEKELAAIKKQMRENTDASPRTISYLEKQITNAYYRNNPNYAAYKKAVTLFKRNTSVGRLYTALNADQQALAERDIGILERDTGLNSELNSLTTGMGPESELTELGNIV